MKPALMLTAVIALVAAAAALVLATACSDLSTDRDAGTDLQSADAALDALPKSDKGMPDQHTDINPPPAFGWAISLGGPESDYAHAIAVDAAGNSYVTGHFKGTAAFGSTWLTSKGDQDIFVAKVSAAGKVLWALRAGGAGWDEGRGISVDGAGNSYVTGKFVNTADFGSKTLTAKGGDDGFVAKVSSSGAVAWAVPVGGSETDEGIAIAVDAAGNSTVTGQFGNTVTLGSKQLTCKGGLDVFVARLAPAGAFSWAVSGGGTGQDTGHGIAVDGAGNSYVAGTYLFTATFGKTQLKSKGSIEHDDDIFVAKVDSGGAFAWAVAGGGPSNDFALGIAADSAGNSCVTGFFQSSAALGGKPLAPRSGTDVFVAGLDSGGKVLWTVSGGGSSRDWGCGAAMDSAGSCYAAGLFSKTATFAGATLTSLGFTDGFVTKVGSGGKVLWAATLGSPSTDQIKAIGVDGAGNSIVVGDFWGATKIGSTNLKAAGAMDVFVARLSGGP